MTDELLLQDSVLKETWEEMRDSFIYQAKFMAEEIAVISKKMTPIERIVYFALRRRQDWEGILIKEQHRIGRYTVDFLVSWEFNNPEQIIIECDGHDFHEKTKEQAQHDKKRDRDLQSLGFKVYRFTGSEIWKTRGKCVTSALRVEPE